MKKILSLLMCYVFLQTETFALRGWTGAGGVTLLLGSYSATMVQTSGGNSLGLVVLNVPQTGPANGDFLTFDSATGEAYVGVANGLSDVSSGQLSCILSGNQINNAAGSVGQVAAAAATPTIAGTMKVGIVDGESSLYQQISGTAIATVSSATVPRTVTFSVTGYQASTTSGTGGGFDITFGTSSGGTSTAGTVP